MFRVESKDFDEPYWLNSEKEVNALLVGVLISGGDHGIETATGWASMTTDELRELGTAEQSGLTITYFEGKF